MQRSDSPLSLPSRHAVMPVHTRQAARLATPGAATGEAQPSPRKRKASKRGGAHQQEAADDAAGLTCLSKDLLLCVVRGVRRRHARDASPSHHRRRIADAFAACR